MRHTIVAICGLCIAARAFAGGIHSGQTSSITFNGYDCTGALSETIDCGRIPTDAVWILESRDRPQLAPRDALEIALGAVRNLDLGPLGGHVADASIRLSPCGEGWIYLINFSVEFNCKEAGEHQYRKNVIAVLMSGEPIIPSRQRQSTTDPGTPRPETPSD